MYTNVEETSKLAFGPSGVITFPTMCRALVRMLEAVGTSEYAVTPKVAMRALKIMRKVTEEMCVCVCVGGI